MHMCVLYIVNYCCLLFRVEENNVADIRWGTNSEDIAAGYVPAKFDRFIRKNCGKR